MAKNSKPFSEEFIKECLVDSVSAHMPCEKRSISEFVKHNKTDRGHCGKSGASVVKQHFPEKSRDVSDTVKLIMFVHGIEFEITDELAGVCSVKRTRTESDLFKGSCMISIGWGINVTNWQVLHGYRAVQI